MLVGTNAPQRLSAIHFWHLDIKKDDIWLESLDYIDTDFTIGSHPDIKAVGLKLHPIHLTDCCIIFNNSDLGHAISVAYVLVSIDMTSLDMITNKREVLQNSNPELKSFDGGSGIYGSDEMRPLRDFRTGMMRYLGWIDRDNISSEDVDRYDDDANTRHYYLQRQDGSIACNMRLTKVDDVEGSLSVGMLKADVAMYDDAVSALDEIKLERPDTQFYDLTRLFPDMRQSPEKVSRAMLELFVEAMHDTAPEDVPGSEDVAWFFATTPQMKRKLDRLGIGYREVARGVFPNDEHDTHFCVIWPAEATEKAKQSDAIADAIARTAILRGHNR